MLSKTINSENSVHSALASNYHFIKKKVKKKNNLLEKKYSLGRKFTTFCTFYLTYKFWQPWAIYVNLNLSATIDKLKLYSRLFLLLCKEITRLDPLKTKSLRDDGLNTTEWFKSPLKYMFIPTEFRSNKGLLNARSCKLRNHHSRCDVNLHVCISSPEWTVSKRAICQS